MLSQETVETLNIETLHDYFLDFSFNRLQNSVQSGMEKTVYIGNIFHNLSFELSESIVNGFIAVQNGKVGIFFLLFLVQNFLINFKDCRYR